MTLEKEQKKRTQPRLHSVPFDSRPRTSRQRGTISVFPSASVLADRSPQEMGAEDGGEHLRTRSSPGSTIPAAACKKKRVAGASTTPARAVRAPQLREPWRKAERSRQLLEPAASDALRTFLDEELLVVPQPGVPALPTLEVTPAEMIRHILARMTALVTDGDRAGAGVFAEVYGGVAQSVVAVNNGLEGVNRPTDFDARFYIPRSYNDARDFDRCRNIVEEFLVMKLRLALDVSEVDLQHKLPNLIRSRYYQKQVVIGGTLSLISVGDAATGKGIDLEFSLNAAGDRKYFDDANSFVIPLSLQHLAGVEAVHALSMATDFDHALSLASKHELMVVQPAQVINGLALYAHAVCDKGLTTVDLGDEQSYGSEMVGSFLRTCDDLRQRSSDPLRFCRSFLRCHYACRPLACLAMVAQLLAELAAYGGLDSDESGVEDRSIMNECAELLASQILAAIASMQPAENRAVVALLDMICFIRSPGNVPASLAEERSVRVQCEGGRQSRLLRKVANCGAQASRLCRQAARLLREHACAEKDAVAKSLIECICGALESEGTAEEEREIVGIDKGRAEPQAAATPTFAEMVAAQAGVAQPTATESAAPAAVPPKPRSWAQMAAGNASRPPEATTEAHASAADRTASSQPLAAPGQGTLAISKRELKCRALPVDIDASAIVEPLGRVSATRLAWDALLCTLAEHTTTPNASVLDAGTSASKLAEVAESHAAQECIGGSQHIYDDAALCAGGGDDGNAARQSGLMAQTDDTDGADGTDGHGDRLGHGSTHSSPAVRGWTSPTTSTEHTWGGRHPQSKSSPGIRLGLGREGTATGREPLFKYQGLFDTVNPVENTILVQLDQPLRAPIFRLEPADTARSYDSFTDTDFDSLADSSLDTPPTSSGAETPTSSASSSSSFSPGPCPATAETPGACAVASLQTLVRCMLGGRAPQHQLDDDFDMSAAHAECAAPPPHLTRGALQAFPAPW